MIISNDLCRKVDSDVVVCKTIGELVSEDWNIIAENVNIYLSLDYLLALENSIDKETEVRYAIFYSKERKPVAIAYFQIFHFIDMNFNYHQFACKVGDKVKNKFIESIDVKALVCGNMFSCGENGFAHSKDISYKEAYRMLVECIKHMSSDKKNNGQISFSLLKEFWPHSRRIISFLKPGSYKSFMIDVNMVLGIRKEWEDFSDYLASMTTKFRTKAKGVYKKSSEIDVRDLNVGDIDKHKNEIEFLYDSVLQKAEYKFGRLSTNAFYNLKNELKDRFIFKGYFVNDSMVGFSSAFVYEEYLDANFVGLDYKVNKEMAVYQRILYDFVDTSIELKVKELRLGRTAELIKSSIGALPVEMKLYVKFKNSISNKIFSPLVGLISPSEFELRLPFKKEVQ